MVLDSTNFFLTSLITLHESDMNYVDIVSVLPFKTLVQLIILDRTVSGVSRLRSDSKYSTHYWN